MTRRFTITGIALLTLGVGGFGIHQYCQHEELRRQSKLVEEMRQREQAERTFPLVDAYKQPPAIYSEYSEHPLYGRIVPRDNTSVAIGGTTAQDLDAKYQIDEDSTKQAQHAEALKASLVESYSNRVTEYYSSFPLPSDSAVDRFERIKRAQAEIQKQTDEIYEPQRKAAVDVAIKTRASRLSTLMAEGKLVVLKRDVRVRILDISGNYAKLRTIDGDHADKTLFFAPFDLRVK